MLMRVFFIVLARDSTGVEEKLEEISALGYPALVVCGEKMEHTNVLYRPARGKYDAMNFGLSFVPADTDVVAFSDVDAKIHNFEAALDFFQDEDVSLVFAKVRVEKGPQRAFYFLLDSLRRRLPIAASGELLLVRHGYIRSIAPIKACKAEDSYILFKILEKRGKAIFCEKCYVTTSRTMHAKEEQVYKRRTVGGIYQALALTKPPRTVKLFYALLPFLSLILIAAGENGFFWFRGILLGYVDYLRGDAAASWQPLHSCSGDTR